MSSSKISNRPWLSSPGGAVRGVAWEWYKQMADPGGPVLCIRYTTKERWE